MGEKIKDSKIFNSLYGSSASPTFGIIPSEELQEYICAKKMTGEALDIGCGDGRDTLFLARVGFQVTAIDVSDVGLKKLMRFAKEQGIDEKISPIAIDIRLWSFPFKYYDLITSATCFDHIPKNYHKDLFENVVASLKPEGILFIEVHTIDDPGFKRQLNDVSELSSVIAYYFERNELLKMVEPKFEIIRYEEKIEEDKDHGKIHIHGFASVLARKRKDI